MNILFFGLDYHTYTRSLISEMEALSQLVTYVDIRPRNLLFKALRTGAPSVYDNFLLAHHAKAISNTKGVNYDKVVFLQAHEMRIEDIARLKQAQQNAEFILYTWDSLTTHDYGNHAPLFDRVITFDRLDAENNGYEYLPLFCQRSMQGLNRSRAVPQSIYMVGNISPNRYAAVQAFRAYCNMNGLIFRQHLKLSPVIWAQMARTGVHPKGVRMNSITADTFREMIETSVGVFDFANHIQTGQTMRMMENLCTGKKIVTNNTCVKREPFYSPDRIHVFEDFDFDGVAEFLRTPLIEPNLDFKEYHVQTFTRRLLGISTEDSKVMI